MSTNDLPGTLSAKRTRFRTGEGGTKTALSSVVSSMMDVASRAKRLGKHVFTYVVPQVTRPYRDRRTIDLGGNSRQLPNCVNDFHNWARQFYFRRRIRLSGYLVRLASPYKGWSKHSSLSRLLPSLAVHLASEQGEWPRVPLVLDVVDLDAGSFDD